MVDNVFGLLCVLQGGVTSSSLEVLAGLSLDADEFAEHMQVGADGVPPPFYDRYVEDICQRVETNARNEFDYIFDEVERNGGYSTEVTNQLSGAMNEMNDIIGASDLFDDVELRKNVLRESLPQSLQDLVRVIGAGWLAGGARRARDRARACVPAALAAPRPPPRHHPLGPVRCGPAALHNCEAHACVRRSACVRACVRCGVTDRGAYTHTHTLHAYIQTSYMQTSHWRRLGVQCC